MESGACSRSVDKSVDVWHEGGRRDLCNERDRPCVCRRWPLFGKGATCVCELGRGVECVIGGLRFDDLKASLVYAVRGSSYR